jgi:uncharacterized repeat protein (TIGR04076 family)
MVSNEKPYPVRVRITEADPTCGAGHRPGQEWIWEDTTPPGLCSSVFASCFNAYLALRYGGQEPEAEMALQSRPGQHGWEGYTNEAMTIVFRRCPDPNKRVVVSLERVVEAATARVAAPPLEQVVFPVKATVLSTAGAGCPVGHPVGQTWLLKGVPAGICAFAFNAMFPAYWTLLFGGDDPRTTETGAMQVTCSAAGCGAAFSVKRVPASEAAGLEANANLISLEELQKTIPARVSRQTQ